MESFLRGLHPSIQILVRAQAPQDLNLAITSVVNVESSYRCAYELQLVATPPPPYYPWLAKHSLPMSTPSLSLPAPSYVPQLQSTPPLQLPPVTPVQLQATPLPLSLLAPTPVIDTSSSSTSLHLLAPVSHAPQHSIIYVTKDSLRLMMNKLEPPERIMRWLVELQTFDYVLKSKPPALQKLVDFSGVV
ncbi:hypothetical protein GOP47_0019488 [Adiantum capillus-veneris]|uniref:Uncharacterized protein n=1 Tax=Adiantum capillus-veneris TaxID=13818 RepID=A0A9D4Z742_ADICA|nr:hypothetical protein GOP47_0019488 [Adiantum capillus-veneris]